MAVTTPGSNPGPGGRVVVVVVVGAVDVAVALFSGGADVVARCAGVDVAEVSRTRKAIPAVSSARTATAKVMTKPDGRRRFPVGAWRAMGDSFVVPPGAHVSRSRLPG